MGGQGSPVSWRRFQTFGRRRQEGRWTQGEVRGGNARGDCPCDESERITISPCSDTRAVLCVCPCFHASAP